MASYLGRRPLPQIEETKAPLPAFNEESDSGGRVRASSTVPRTMFTPQVEKAAMNKLKQKMTFSDLSVSFCQIYSCQLGIHKTYSSLFPLLMFVFVGHKLS